MTDYADLEKRLRDLAALLNDSANALASLRRELEETREEAAQIAERTGPQPNPRWDQAGVEAHMWRNTHWQEAQEAIAQAIRGQSGPPPPATHREDRGCA